MSSIDLFAGPGGWDTGIVALGICPLGIEWDELACATARAAGHERLQADVAKLTPSDHADSALDGLIASPPCQGFSLAGKGAGRKDSERIIRAAAEFGSGRDPRDDLVTKVHDPRSILALEPLRWALDLEPEWTCWEQVPAVLPLWEACAEVLRADGYSVWTGNVQAEQYGVPQTRKRAILIASRNRQVGRPTPTHSQFYPRNRGKLDLGVEKWVSMAEALGWGMTHRPAGVVRTGGGPRGGTDALGGGTGSVELYRREREEGRWLVRDSFGTPQSDYAGRLNSRWKDAAARPAPAITSKTRDWQVRWEPAVAVEGDTSWVYERPSPTIVGSFHPEIVAAPGYRKAGDPPRQKTPGSVRITVEEAACLQSFPTYPWQGSRTAQFRQVGDAVPPAARAARRGRGDRAGAPGCGSGGMTEHEFAYDDAGRMRCACGTYLFQHAPDHPYGSQAGPGGMFSRWCLRDDCDWRSTSKPATSGAGGAA